MNNLFLSFSVVFPLFVMMALGYFLRVIKIFNEEFLIQLNNLCFKVFLPLILFINIYNSDFKGQFSVKLVVFAVLTTIICFVLLMVFVPMLERDNDKRGVIIQGIFRSNYILFGIPITATIFGSENVSVTAILIAFVIPLYNALSVIGLETYSSKAFDIKKILKGVALNPLIIGSVFAFFFVLTGIRLPGLMVTTISDISKVSTPLALIVLGGSFKFMDTRRSIKQLTASVFGKLIIVPLVFIPVSILFGFRGPELVALMGMFASPTSVSTYTMAQNLHGDYRLAAQIVVVDSIGSIFTIFIFISILAQMSLI